MKSIEAISVQITALEAIRDNTPEEFSNSDAELLTILNLCYDLLTRTKEVNEITVKLSDMDRDLLEEDSNIIQKYPKSTSELADFAFSLSTKKGSINLRKLLRESIFGHTQAEISKKINIRQATISDYLKEKKSLTCDNYEKVINSTFK